MYESHRERRSEDDRLTEKFADPLSERRKRAKQVRRLVNDNDMSPDLAREIVDARLRRRNQSKKGGR
jgi:phosphoenolpyruvate synthase/pyruvate phosphate dikinase